MTKESTKPETASEAITSEKKTNKGMLVITRPLTGKLTRGYSLAVMRDGTTTEMGVLQLRDYAYGLAQSAGEMAKETRKGLTLLEAIAVGAKICDNSNNGLRRCYLISMFGGCALHSIATRAKLAKDRKAALEPVNEAQKKHTGALLLGLPKEIQAKYEQKIATARENAKKPLADIATKLAKIERDERALVAYVAANLHLLTAISDPAEEAKNRDKRKFMRTRGKSALEKIAKTREQMRQAEREEKRDPATAQAIADRKEAQRKTARKVHGKRTTKKEIKETAKAAAPVAA